MNGRAAAMPFTSDKPYVVLGCGKEKRLKKGEYEPLPLIDLYCGPLYSDRLAYARELGGPHCILSAFHGWRRPTYGSGWYDRSIEEVMKDRAWRECTFACFRDGILQTTEPGDVIVVLASRNYIEPYGPLLKREGRIVEKPLQGMGLGAQRAQLRRAIAERRQEPLFASPS